MNAKDNLNILSEERFQLKFDELMERSFYKSALELSLNALKRNPTNILYLVACAYCYTEMRKFRKAKALINSANQIDPNDSFLIYTHAIWYTRQNKFSQAEKLLFSYYNREQRLETALKLCNLYSTQYSVYRYVIFKFPWWTKKKISDKHFSIAEKIATQHNAELLAEKIKAEFYVNNKIIKKAHACLNKVISMDPSDSWAYISKAQAYLLKGRNSPAKKILIQGLALKPNDQFGLYLLAYIKATGDTKNLYLIYSYIRKVLNVLLFFVLLITNCTVYAFIIPSILNRFTQSRVEKEFKKLNSIELKPF